MTNTLILKFGCVLLILLAQATVAQETMGLYFRVNAPETKTDGTPWEPGVAGGLPDIFVCFRATNRRWDCAPPCQDSQECAGKLNVVPVGKPLTIGVFDRDIQQNDPMYNFNIKDARRCTSGDANPCQFAYGGRIAVTLGNSPVLNCLGEFCCFHDYAYPGRVEVNGGVYNYCQKPNDTKYGNCHATSFLSCKDCRFFADPDKNITLEQIKRMGYTEPVLHPKEAQPGDVLLFRNLSDQIFHSELIYMNDPKAYCASSGTDGVFWVRRNDLHNVFKDDLDQHFCYNYYWKIFNHGGRIAGGVIIEGGLEIWRNPNPTPIEFIPPGGGGN